tara:strand:+ start:24242 stop:24547 length:306 start_codon:yes stop_codon:yes gene_type:complete
MNRSYLAISLPALSGIVLVFLVFFNLSQFHSGVIEVGDMLRRELPVVMFGLVSSLGLFVMAVTWVFKRQWLKSLSAVISILVFFICFILAGVNGGAFVNAT